MYRIAVSLTKELDKRIEVLVTRSIILHMERYFTEDYKDYLNENLYLKVKDSIMEILHSKNNFKGHEENKGNIHQLKVKVAEFMLLLQDKKSHRVDSYMSFLLNCLGERAIYDEFKVLDKLRNELQDLVEELALYYITENHQIEDFENGLKEFIQCTTYSILCPAYSYKVEHLKNYQNNLLYWDDEFKTYYKIDKSNTPIFY